jgi:hypothetical protein
VNSSLTCNTLEDYVEAALRVERNMTPTKIGVIAAVTGAAAAVVHDQDIEATDEDPPLVAALKAELRNFRANKGGKGKKTNGVKGKSGTPRRDADGPPRRRCFNCNSEDHLIRDCPEPKKPRSGGKGGGGRPSGQQQQGGFIGQYGVAENSVIAQRALEIGLRQLGVGGSGLPNYSQPSYTPPNYTLPQSANAIQTGIAPQPLPWGPFPNFQ